VFLPRGERFTRKFMLEEVMKDFMFRVSIPKTKDKNRKVKLHMDNAKPHRIDEEMAGLNVPRVEHPPYSPDLAPCDFFLFGYLKFMLEGLFFESDEELIAATREIMAGIPRKTFEKVFEEWISRLEKCVALNGDYVF
jgi:hypothetical protein